jgi:hypothetical protein
MSDWIKHNNVTIPIDIVIVGNITFVSNHTNPLSCFAFSGGYFLPEERMYISKSYPTIPGAIAHEFGHYKGRLTDNYYCSGCSLLRKFCTCLCPVGHTRSTCTCVPNPLPYFKPDPDSPNNIMTNDFHNTALWDSDSEALLNTAN